MDEGRPGGPRAKWWSRPAPGKPTDGTTPPVPERAPDARPDAASSANGNAPGQGQGPDQVPDAARPPADAALRHDVPPAGVSQEAIPARRATGHSAAGQVPGHGEDPAGEPAGSAPVPGPGGGGRPLHDPDPYGTPPYGEPGPWAPAPPVQRPAPAQDAPVPPAQLAGELGPEHRQTPHPPHGTGPQGHPPSQWLQYDPWSAAPPQALTYGGEPSRKRRRGGLFAGALVIALVAGGVGGGVGAYIERNDGFGGDSVRLPQAGKAPADRAPDTVAGIAASALPSVVTFHVSGSSGKGTGTGFVLDDKGHILTNNHVVEPAGKSGVISLTFSGGESARAKLVGKDSGYDLAVVKVTGVSGMKPLPLGNSDNVRVGDPVVAIGAPFDLQNTVTAGIISAKQRPITAGGEKGDGSDVSYVDALQTDAPINPGNSGGPLVDSQARAIGVNSAIRGPDTGGLDSGQAGSIGLGFAIPINQAKRVAEELISTGRATHPVIGVSLDMKFTGDGARVGAKGANDTPAVTPGGPGAKAGIKPGDVITKVDGQRVHSGEELIVKIRSKRPGERMGLTLVRDGKERMVALVLGSAGDS
ncbi:trypsin-like peptidase domain-containing protein [Streptomyces sp. NPDC088745]|uniref:trypsin-like peptidase domain-containing protein n=1 Tax=Streptomyces sp. NPDC088745 TaxID=3365884 RepID=UPI00382D1497